MQKNKKCILLVVMDNTGTFQTRGPMDYIYTSRGYQQWRHLPITNQMSTEFFCINCSRGMTVDNWLIQATQTSSFSFMHEATVCNHLPQGRCRRHNLMIEKYILEHVNVI